MMHTVRYLVLSVVFLSFLAGGVFAFSDDICQDYRKGSDGLQGSEFNCYDLTDEDSSGGDVATGMITYMQAAFTDKYYVRSSIHFDVAYLLSRISGFNHDDALEVAVYSEATDLGEFKPYDSNGEPLNTYASDNIDSVTRTSASGFWLHYVPWMRAEGSDQQDALYTYDASEPNGSPFSDEEVPINHIRKWAFNEGAPFCKLGLTDENGDCLDKDSRLYLEAPLLGNYSTSDTIPLGRQWVNPYNIDYADEISGTKKALGIYLHAMIDRLSHHFCSDGAYISTDNPDYSNLEYSLIYPPACGQVIHAMLHYKETGHPPTPKRTMDAVRYLFWEINKWIDATGFQRESNYHKVKNEDKLFNLIFEALGTADAKERVDALCGIAARYNIEWHNGKACK